MTSSERKVALITGATDGIGRETARLLSEVGWRVIVHGRNVDRVAAATDYLRGAVPDGHFEPVTADLAALCQVEALAEWLLGYCDPLDALVNNAGVFTSTSVADVRTESADGFELTWAVNYLAPFALTLKVLPLLLSAKQCQVLNVGSSAHLRGELCWHDLQCRQHWDRMAAYAQSKLAIAMFTVELSERCAGTPVTVNVASPGYTATKMVRDGLGGPALPVEEGAANIAQLLLETRWAARSGCYIDQAVVREPHPLVSDRLARRRLWRISAAQAATHDPMSTIE
jgi:NAD(P)-dependent dehydrogenase (short-subunit alcohol dehydrogenase family)